MKWFTDAKKKSEKNLVDRQSERIEFYQSSYYKVEDGKELTYECWFNNISMGGLCLDTNNEGLKNDDIVRTLYKIGFKIRNDTCKICYKSKALNNWRYGCRFTDSDPQRDELIKQYIMEHMLKK